MFAQDSMFSFCKEVGILKENFTLEVGLNAIKEHMSKISDVDPEFLEMVKKLTVADINKYCGVIYRYDIELDWYKGGNKYHNNINNFGNAGVPEGLHITEYYKEGNYTILNKPSDCKLQIWNDKNVFTYEELKGALKHVIESKLPNGWSKYSSTDWTVSAYFVPLFCIKINFNGKVYNLNYNLHNGRFNYGYPVSKKLLNTAKTYKKVAPLFKVASWLLSVLGVVYIVLTFKSFADNWMQIVGVLVSILINVFLFNKSKKESEYKEIIKKSKSGAFLKCFTKELIKIVVVLVVVIISLFVL